MELQESREYKAAKELERALNDMSWNPQKFAESTRYYHRTLQQELMKPLWQSLKWLVIRGTEQTLEIKPHMNFAERLLTVGYWMIVTCLLYNVMRGHLFI